MTTSTVTLARPSRPSFQQVLALFMSGLAAKNAAPLVWMGGTLCMVVTLLAVSRSADFWFATVIGPPSLVSATIAFELAGAQALAFIKVLPLGRATKWLALLPPCGLLLALAVLAAALRHFSIPVALTLLGSAWWAVSIGHRFAGRRARWLWLGVPLSFLGAAAAQIAFASGGWWLAAIVSQTMALVSLAVARDRVGDLLAGAAAPSRGSRRRARIAAASSSSRASWRSPSRAPQPSLLQVTRGVWSLSLPRGFWIWSLVLPMPIILALRERLPVMSMFWYATIIPMSSMIALAHAPAAREFLRTRPLRRGWLLAGTVAPWTLFSLWQPVIAFLRVRSGVLRGGLDQAHDPLVLSRDEQLRYLREVIGATWFPAAAARGPLSPEVWAALQPLLYQHVLRMAILTLALVFSITAATITDSHHRASGARRWPNRLLAVVTFLAILPYINRFALWHARWTAPPIWLSVVLALAGMISMWRAIEQPR
jgi:hypothetical protein